MKLEWADAVRQVQRLSLLRYFPVGNEEAIKALAEKFQSWGTKEQIQALVVRALDEMEWQGIGELRALFMRMYPPPIESSPDGTDANKRYKPDWMDKPRDMCPVCKAEGCFAHLAEIRKGHHAECICVQCESMRRGQ